MQPLFFETAPPTLIAEGTRVQGGLTFHSGTQVFGTIEGELNQLSFENLLIGKTGWVHGSIHSKGPVVVEGQVEGDITSSVRIRLSPTANVRGTLNAPSIEVRAGAMFEGDMQMNHVAKQSGEHVTQAKKHHHPKKAA